MMVRPKNAYRVLFNSDIEAINGVTLDDFSPRFLVAILVLDVPVGANLYFRDFVVQLVVFNFEQLEEVIGGGLDFGHFAALKSI